MSRPTSSGSPALAKFLRTARAAAGRTQDEQAAKITSDGYEVSGETLSRWELTGKCPPLRDPNHARVLARAYGTTPATLLKLAGYLDFLPIGELDSIISKLPARLLNLLDQATVAYIS